MAKNAFPHSYFKLTTLFDRYKLLFFFAFPHTKIDLLSIFFSCVAFLRSECCCVYFLLFWYFWKCFFFSSLLSFLLLLTSVWRFEMKYNYWREQCVQTHEKRKKKKCSISEETEMKHNDNDDVDNLPNVRKRTMMRVNTTCFAWYLYVCIYLWAFYSFSILLYWRCCFDPTNKCVA